MGQSLPVAKVANGKNKLALLAHRANHSFLAAETQQSNIVYFGEATLGIGEFLTRLGVCVLIRQHEEL